VTEAVIAALRAHVAGFPAGQPGIDLLISHGGFLTRPGFRRFADTFTCVSDGTPTAQIGWQSVHTAGHEGHLPPLRRRMAHPEDRRQPRSGHRRQPA